MYLTQYYRFASKHQHMCALSHIKCSKCPPLAWIHAARSVSTYSSVKAARPLGRSRL